MAQILNGRQLAKERAAGLRERVASLGRRPGLAVVLVGQDPASQVYVSKKTAACDRIGLLHRQLSLPATTSQADLLRQVDVLNADPEIDGILVQLPLPAHLDASAVLDRIDARKDVDGFHPENLGLLAQGRPRFVACTPAGCMHLLRRWDVSLEGRSALVIGRSTIVGRPMSLLLDRANATVTVAHSRTRDLAERVAAADIVVAAIGRPEAIRGAWIKAGAAVIDVGINRLADGRLVGDVEFAVAVDRASAITPVPGGVGPMTISMLMENTIEAATRRQR
jgi:methylenetetrahydrofolate dehydrogenase (NADP+)/methenyltetrahydrofolate cyclohydrolase